MKSKLFIGLSFIFLCVVAMIVARPVPIVSESEALIEEGIVTNIYEGGVKDIVFKLENNDKIFYINRGLEQGLDIASLKEKLIGKNVIFKYPKHWTPLDWDNTTKHISKVQTNNEVIFNELKK
ncbi:hypothetical protein [Aquimarina litoralis]|uniref:hypothetical protein n=1 Tax=Aquimarina litoralis TaxID=584605 RepID=UPI001C596214|nr:hypothetical protein [Aquimarina litoralis]MBW1297458.1 hypothetical protein [Aquimarina litoralis]